MALKALNDYTGRVIGNVTVLHKVKHYKVNVVRTGEEYLPPKMWRCRCSCGVEWDVPHARISTHSPAYCQACSAQHRTPRLKLPRTSIHKKSHPSYGSWYSMLRRCYHTNHQNYKNYGGRGITVTPRWYDFDHFVADMGIRPVGHTIDRINNNMGYSPQNCRWATIAQQAKNKRAYKKRRPR